MRYDVKQQQYVPSATWRSFIIPQETVSENETAKQAATQDGKKETIKDSPPTRAIRLGGTAKARILCGRVEVRQWQYNAGRYWWDGAIPIRQPITRSRHSTKNILFHIDAW